MKHLWAAALVLMVIMGGCLIGERWVTQVTTELVQELEQARTLADENDWDKALAVTQDVLKRWESHEFPLHALLRHTETDQVWLSLQAVLEYLQLEEMDQYAAANSQLITQLELLAEMERPSWENVL